MSASSQGWSVDWEEAMQRIAAEVRQRCPEQDIRVAMFFNDMIVLAWAQGWVEVRYDAEARAMPFPDYVERFLLPALAFIRHKQEEQADE